MEYSMEAERQFGPVLSSPNDTTFDFTLLFEEVILTALPLGIARTLNRNRKAPVTTVM